MRDRPRVPMYMYVNMSGQAIYDQEAGSSGPKKRSIFKTTADKWIVENDKASNTAVWLKYDTDSADRTHIVVLKCSVCARFSDRLVGRWNYSAAFVKGSENLRASSFKDHAASDMPSSAMLLLKKQVGVYTYTYVCTLTYTYASLEQRYLFSYVSGIHGYLPLRTNRSIPAQA